MSCYISNSIIIINSLLLILIIIGLILLSSGIIYNGITSDQDSTYWGLVGSGLGIIIFAVLLIIIITLVVFIFKIINKVKPEKYEGFNFSNDPCFIQDAAAAEVASPYVYTMQELPEDFII